MRKKVITIAIVDDDKGTRELLAKRIGQEEDMRCIRLFNEPNSAMKELPDLCPDIVLMDINMPIMSGIECVQKLKDRMPDTDFLMLTVHEDSRCIFDALSAGASGYLLKRSAGEKLASAIREAAAGGSPMDSRIARKVVQSFRAPPRVSSAKLEAISEREQQVLELIARGHQTKEIADMLDIGSGTVLTYIRRIYKKLQVNSRIEAVNVMRGLQSGD